MSLLHLLEDFGGTRGAAGSHPAPNDEEIETRRLAAFEEGYQAGWDDALHAHTQDRMRLTSDLAQNLLDMSFTYNEAYTHLFRELRPLLVEIVDKLLPRMLRHSIGPRIVEELQAAATDTLRGEAHILVNPDVAETVAALVAQDGAFPVSIRGDAALTEGQAQLSLPDREIEINLDQMIAEISSALEAFTHDLQKEDPDDRKHAV